MLQSLWIDKGYTTTKQLNSLYIDENKKMWYVLGCSRVYSYSDIINCKIFKNYVKRTVVNRIEVHITVNDSSSSLIRIKLLDTKFSTSSFTYKSLLNTAQQIVAQLNYMKVQKTPIPKSINTVFNTSSFTKRMTYRDRPKIKYSKIQATPNNYIVFDLETTGLDNIDNKIIEIGAIKYIEGKEQGRFHTYVNPDEHISFEITSINHISDDDVKNAPFVKEALMNFLNFIGEYTLIAFNSDFDMAFLQYNISKYFECDIKNDVIDALPLAYQYLSELPNKKLTTIKKYFNLDVGSHNAIDDCIVTNHLYQYCKQFEDLKYKYVIPFPYNPQELSDLEVEYINTAVEICEKNGISKKNLSLYKNSKLLSIKKNNSDTTDTVVSFKLYGKLQYTLLNIPFEKFESECKTDIKHTASSKSEGNYTRVLTENPQQLWEFEKYIIKK